MALTYPDLLPGVFAAGASNHDEIPDTYTDEGRMAWDVGFPSETSQPIVAGGVPPRRLDMNGLGNRLSQHVFFQQSGALYVWSADLDYPAGAHILGSNGVEYIAVAASGPTVTGGAVNPVNDVNFTRWKSYQRSLVDIIYPVGSIYMSVNNVNPGTLFGGVWQAISGRFLLAANSTYPLGTTGGSANKQLSVNEMPVHSHVASTADAGGHVHTATNANAGAHTHTVTVQSNGAHTHSTSGTAASNGSHTHTITVNNNGAHTHTTSGTAASAGAHTHNISVTNGAQSAGAHTHGVTYAATSVSATAASNGAHTHGAPASKTTITTSNPSPATHYHTRGTMNITGRFDANDLTDDKTTPTASGAFGYAQSTKPRESQDGTNVPGYAITFDASNSGAWTGHTSSDGSHTHTVTINASALTTTSAGAHTHSVSITVPAQNMTTGSAGAHTHNLSGSTASAGAHTHTVSGTAASAGAHNHVATNANAGAHTHTTSGTAASAGTHNHAASTASAGSHTHTITVQTAGVHQHGVTVNTAGGSASFNIMPPYLAVNIWKRTA